jgi:lysophospholipase L1-like esterase
MKPSFFVRLGILASLLLAGTTSAFEQPKVYDLKPNDYVYVIGDSTTHQGTLPAGYVPLTDQAVQEQLPGKNIKVDGFHGGSGATSGDHVKFVGPHLDQVIKAGRTPTAVVINIGLNDTGRGQGLPAYGDNLRKMVADIRARKMTAMLCATTTYRDLKFMTPYADMARTVAAELHCPLIDLQAAHVAHIEANTKDGKRVPGTDPTVDGLHLSAVGETISAKTFLQAFGLKPAWQAYQVRMVAMREGWATGVHGTFTYEPKLASYPSGSKVTVTLIPAAGCEFSQWQDMDYRGTPKASQPELGSSATITLTMDRHRFLMGYVRPKREDGTKP